MKNSAWYEQIEAYLNRTLPPDEQAAMTRRLAEDPELRREVELHRQLQADFDPGRLHLRDQLNDVMNEPLPPDDAPDSGGPWRFWWLGLALALLAAWYFWPWQQPEAVAPPVVPPVEAPVQPPVEQPATETPAADPLPPPANRPIAAADPARFRPNPGMEAFVNGGVRSETMTATLTQPANGQRFLPDENQRVSVRFTGTVHWPVDETPPPWVIQLFDNRNTAQPLLTLPLPAPADQADRLDFSVSQRLSYPSGLYYFTVETADGAEILYAGKFLIGE